jgi:hypothetical protein
MMKNIVTIFGILILLGCSGTDYKIEPSDTCYKGIKLGDNLSRVQLKLKGLRVNPEGETNEYFTISEAPIEMDEGQLNPSVFLKFNENNELYHFIISFTYDGLEKNNELGWKIFNELLKQDILCLKGETQNGESQMKNATRKTRFEENGFPSFTYEVQSK